MMAMHPQAKILVVDDQEFNVRLLERILQHGGYTCVRGLHDSRRVLQTFQEFEPDLILLDLMMPHLDGIAVLEQLKPYTEGSYLPILVLTADIAANTRRDALAAGAKDFLTKPFDAAEAQLRIQNLLEARFMHLRIRQYENAGILECAVLMDGAK